MSARTYSVAMAVFQGLVVLGATHSYRVAFFTAFIILGAHLITKWEAEEEQGKQPVRKRFSKLYLREGNPALLRSKRQ